MLIGLIVVAAASLATAQRLVEPLWRADAALTIEPAADAGQRAGWLDAERRILMSSAVLHEAVSQLQQRGNQRFEQSTQLRSDLEQALATSVAEDGSLELAYSKRVGPEGRDELRLILAALTRARLGYALARNATKDEPRQTVRISRSAVLNTSPVQDSRFAVSAGMFTGVTVTALVLILLVRWRLQYGDRVLGHEKTAPVMGPMKADDAWPRDFETEMSGVERELQEDSPPSQR